jgi:FtsH-binding integral membrane protein
MTATPSGWTQISLTSTTSAVRQIQRVIYKILTISDLGSTLTLSASANGTYNKTRLITFTPSVAVTGVNISSLTVDANTVPARTKPASAFDPPSIVFAAASFYNGVSNGGFSETYWTQEYINFSFTSLVTAFEIQDDANTERTITPLFTGTALINHSFVLNVTT